MAFPLIKALHYIGLAALLGGPAFWYLVWRPARFAAQEDALTPADATFRLTTRGTMVAGFILFTMSGILDLMRAASELFGFLYWEDFVAFATISPMGQVILSRIGIALLFLLTGLRLSTRRRTLSWVAPLVAGLGVSVLVSVLSHQAGKETIAPLIADIIHLVATGLWGGGVLYFALLPWRSLRSESLGPSRLAHAASSFSSIGLLCVGVLTATGIYISLQQFYSAVAVTGTPYGLSLLRKLAGFGLVMVVAAIHHFFFVPGLLKGSGEGDVERVRRLGTTFLRLVRVESVLLVGVLVAAGFLTTQMPPVSPVGLVNVANESGIFEGNRYNLTLQPRENGQILFELLVEDPSGQPLVLDSAELDLTMLDHYMPPYLLPMEQIDPGIYRATALLSMGGRWHVAAMWSWGEQASYQIDFEFDTLSSLRDTQQQRRYDWGAIAGKRWGWPLFLIYGAAAIAGVFAVIRGSRTPRSVLLLTLGVLLFFGGGAQMLRVAEVPGPYSFRVNPVTRTAAVLDRGADLYQANCLMCHGIEGRGDGPVAAGMSPLPADFTAQQGIDVHSDGELYWWISQGIAGSSMPAFENLLTEEERWTLVHYIRTFSESARQHSLH